jgi:N-acetylmuramoyl-L-alanine amidase
LLENRNKKDKLKNFIKTKKVFGKVSLVITCVSVVLLASFKPIDPQDDQGTQRKLKTIVLDAGHGGHDSGAVGRQSKEKDIALQVALKLGKKIQKEFPGIKVVYTRTTDVYPKLYERPALANKHHADLFISIHCNSGGASSRRVKNSRGKYVTQRVLNTSAKGTETLVLGFSRTGDQDVAIRENAFILMEENYKENYGGFDPKDPSTYIVFSLMKRRYREQSIKLASYMQDQFAGSNRTDRGVKEQSLAVLATAGMPAVLTEIGFISNPDEERFMMSSAGQESIVNDLFNAINTYRKSVEK